MARRGQSAAFFPQSIFDVPDEYFKEAIIWNGKSGLEKTAFADGRLSNSNTALTSSTLSQEMLKKHASHVVSLVLLSNFEGQDGETGGKDKHVNLTNTGALPASGPQEHPLGYSNPEAENEGRECEEGRFGAEDAVADISLAAVRLQSPETVEGSRNVGESEAAEESSSAFTCHLCGTQYESLQEQRAHFRTDWHRFNVKRRVARRPPISESEFELRAEEGLNRHDKHGESDLSSISGSEAEDDEGEVLKSTPAQSNWRSPKVIFVHPSSGVRFAIWRVLVTDQHTGVDPDEKILNQLRRFAEPEIASTDSRQSSTLETGLPDESGRGLHKKSSGLNHTPSGLSGKRNEEETESSKSRRGDNGSALPSRRAPWIVILSAGGHFAAIVVNPRGGAVIAHQTFHRYVVRAKAGGRQSTQDATGRAPKSAGSSLRRYNEQALEKDIRELLAAWKEHLDGAALVFVHAPSSNRKALFGGEEAPLKREDLRLRNVPISIRRPTFKEAKKVAETLAFIDYNVDRYVVSVTPGKGAADPSKVSPEPLILQQSPTQDIAQTAGKPEPPGSVASGGAETEQESAAAEQFSTPLHEAASKGDVTLIVQLLEAGADPTVKNYRGHTPYASAKDKASRNAFRKFMAMNELLWDWHLAHVPSGLTDEQEAAQAAKKAEKDAQRRAREKERKAEKRVRDKLLKEKAAQEEAKAAEAEALRLVRHGQQGAVKAGTSGKPQPSAEAAEARSRLTAAGSVLQSNRSDGSLLECDCCGGSLIGKVPFHRLVYKYCSTACVHVHRLELEKGR